MGIAAALVLVSAGPGLASPTGEERPPASVSSTASTIDPAIDAILDNVAASAPETLDPSAVSLPSTAVGINVGILTASGDGSGPPELSTQETVPSGLRADTPITLQAVDVDNSAVKLTDEVQSLITVLHEGTSTAEFTMEVPVGLTASIQPDGSINLVDENQISYTFVAAPWAVDANGQHLPTHYQVEGDMLVQHVDTTDATFPVAADPSLQWVPLPHLALWGFQIKQFQVIATALATGGAWTGCTFSKLTGVPGKILNQICTVLGVSGAIGVVNIVKNVWSNNSTVNNSTCYGIPLYNPGSSLRIMPARDCA